MKTLITLFSFISGFFLMNVSAQTLIKDINPGSGSSMLGLSFMNMNGTLYFVGFNGNSANGAELWKSDGTESGTAMVKDINPGAIGSMTSDPSFGNGNGVLYFSPYVAQTNYELWKSDGTEAGTAMVKNINQGVLASYPGGYVNVGGKILFAAEESTHGRELWITDGTEAGTTMVKDIMPGVNGTFSGNPTFTVFNGAAYFLASDGVAGYELWKSDGTEAGTVLVKDINPGNGTSASGFMAVVNGSLFFAANDGTHGRELWKTDGTDAGTEMILDINLGSATSFPLIMTPSYYTVVGNTYYFQADDGVHGSELWKSDGTGAGTMMVKDIATGVVSGYSANLTAMNGTLYFVARNASNEYQLWRTDGTESGTTVILPPVAFDFNGPSSLKSIGSTLYFVATTDADGRELWKTDGTTAGMQMISVNPGADDANPDNLIDVNGTLFFTAIDGTHGRELWKYDGSGPTGLASLPADERIRIYPNPSSGRLLIDHYEGAAEIYNAQGQLIYRSEIYGSSSIDISGHPEGIYLVKFLSHNALSWKRLVLIH